MEFITLTKKQFESLNPYKLLPSLICLYGRIYKNVYKRNRKR